LSDELARHLLTSALRTAWP